MSPDKPQEQSNPQLTQYPPHSGDIGLERPVPPVKEFKKEFDKTLLSEAVDQGLVNIPDTIEPLEQPQPASERKKGVPLWAKIIAPMTAAAALGGGLVAFSGGSSEKSKPTSSVTNTLDKQPKQNPDVNQSVTKTPERPTASVSEFLPSVEKSPVEAIKAHIVLEDLTSTTLSEAQLAPYLFVDTNEATSIKFKEWMDVVREIRRVRAAVGPVGIYTDPKDVTVEILSQTPTTVTAKVSSNYKIIDWDDTNRQFIEKTINSSDIKTFRNKNVGGITVWALSSQQGTVPTNISQRPISRDQANKLLYDAFDKKDALLNYLGISK